MHDIKLYVASCFLAHSWNINHTHDTENTVNISKQLEKLLDLTFHSLVICHTSGKLLKQMPSYLHHRTNLLTQSWLDVCNLLAKYIYICINCKKLWEAKAFCMFKLLYTTLWNYILNKSIHWPLWKHPEEWQINYH